MAATKVNLKSAGDLTMLIFPWKSLKDHMLIDFF